MTFPCIKLTFGKEVAAKKLANMVEEVWIK
jgi:hypothetical protein